MTEQSAPARGSMAVKVIVRILLALIVGVGVFAVKWYWFGDRARSAQVGDCVSGPPGEIVDETVTRVATVPCGSAEARFTVAGRVDGVTDIASPECDKFFDEGEKFTVYSSTSSGGYLLCLRPK